MVTNVQAHRIDMRGLAIRGAEAGLISSVVMAVIAMIVTPLVGSGVDAWSFPKSVASIILGDSASTHLTGFAFGYVLLGLVLHLLIGAVVGAVFALLIGEFDIEEPAPIVLAGLCYSVVVYLLTWALLGNLAFHALTKIPIVVVFWSYAVFGIVAGLMLGTWERTFDKGVDMDRPIRVPSTRDRFDNIQHVDGMDRP